MGGSLLRELRGNGAADARPAPSPARAKPAARTRANSKPKRGTAGTRANSKPKRGAARTRAKGQPKPPAARTGAKARPKRAPRRKPLDDGTIARKIESTIFRGVEVDKGKVDVNVAEGVVWLRGEVGTPDLINELEARAARALADYEQDPEVLARRAMQIASEVCVFTNDRLTIETIEA